MKDTCCHTKKQEMDKARIFPDAFIDSILQRAHEPVEKQWSLFLGVPHIIVLEPVLHRVFLNRAGGHCMFMLDDILIRLRNFHEGIVMFLKILVAKRKEDKEEDAKGAFKWEFGRISAIMEELEDHPVPPFSEKKSNELVLLNMLEDKIIKGAILFMYLDKGDAKLDDVEKKHMPIFKMYRSENIVEMPVERSKFDQFDRLRDSCKKMNDLQAKMPPLPDNDYVKVGEDVD